MACLTDSIDSGPAMSNPCPSVLRAHSFFDVIILHLTILSLIVLQFIFLISPFPRNNLALTTGLECPADYISNSCISQCKMDFWTLDHVKINLERDMLSQFLLF